MRFDSRSDGLLDTTIFSHEPNLFTRYGTVFPMAGGSAMALFLIGYSVGFTLAPWTTMARRIR